MVLGDVLAEHEADSRPIGLGRIERHEQVAAVRESRALIVDGHDDAAPLATPIRLDTTSRLQGRVDRVRHQVDERLVELVPVRRDTHGFAVPHGHVQARLQAGDMPDPRLHVDLCQARGWQAGEPRVGGEEAAQRLGSRGDDRQTVLRIGRPVRRACLGNQFLNAGGDRLDRRQGVVDLVAEHAHQSSPRLAFLVAQRAFEVGHHDQRQALSLLANHAPAHLPVPRAGRLAPGHRARCVALQGIVDPKLGRRLAEQVGLRVAQQTLRSAVHHA